MSASPTDGQKHCPTHDVWYGKLEQCSVCRAERAGSAPAASPKADTKPLRVKAAEYRLREYEMWTASKGMLIDDPHVAVKLSDQSGKWAGRADDIEVKLLEIEHHQWMLEQDRLRRGGN